MSRSQQTEHRLQDADVCFASRDDNLARPAGQQRRKARIGNCRKCRLGQHTPWVGGERRNRTAQASRVLLSGVNWHIEKLRRLREPRSPGHHGLSIMDDGHQPLLQVDQEQHGAVCGGQHTADATSSNGGSPGSPGHTAHARRSEGEGGQAGYRMDGPAVLGDAGATARGRAGGHRDCLLWPGLAPVTVAGSRPSYCGRVSAQAAWAVARSAWARRARTACAGSSAE